MLYKLTTMIIATGLVAGCQLITPETVTTIRAASLKQCQVIQTQLEPAYAVIRDSGTLKASTIKKADKAFAAADAFCESSQQLTPENALVTAALLYLQVAQIMKEVHNG